LPVLACQLLELCPQPVLLSLFPLQRQLLASYPPCHPQLELCPLLVPPRQELPELHRASS
jgi:hypothetical protein